MNCKLFFIFQNMEGVLMDKMMILMMMMNNLNQMILIKMKMLSQNKKMNDLYENYAFNIRFILYFNNKLNFVKINIKELLYIF